MYLKIYVTPLCRFDGAGRLGHLVHQILVGSCGWMADHFVDRLCHDVFAYHVADGGDACRRCHVVVVVVVQRLLSTNAEQCITH